MNLPNLVTLSRVPALFVVVGLLFIQGPWAARGALAVFVVGGITDWLDGYLARKFGMVSSFGKLMDALTDKILIVGLMVAMLVPLPDGSTPPLPPWGVFGVLLILTREFLVTGLRLVAASQGRVLAAERSGKIKTVLQLVSIGVLLLAHAMDEDPSADAVTVGYVEMTGLGLFAVAAVLTAASGTGYLIKYWDIFMGRPSVKPAAET